jgi:phosphoglycerate dehydrogenase-like enzyme
MTKKLLITDSFFVFDDNVKALEAAGYEVIRLDEPKATEQQMVEAIKGTSVYIIGGVEQVTAAVIAAADELKAIIFSGVDYSNFIPAEQAALSKGIKLLNAPGANAIAVAEFAVGMAISMQRRFQDIGRYGDKQFLTTLSIQGSKIGIVGAGDIGSKILEAVSVFGPSEIVYYNRSVKDIPARKVELDELVSESDIIFVSLPKHAGTIFDTEVITKIKKGSLIVSVSPENLFDMDALLPRLQVGEVRFGFDHPSPSPEFDALSSEAWFSVKSHSGYNTAPAIKAVSDKVTDVAVQLYGQI